ncbi:MAG TPA: hypothetical protein VH120_03710 [Gemmataceae bacterium]|nr:hypothetical protein [Gemmataceae bacterium]
MKKYVLTTRGLGRERPDMPDERVMVDPVGMTVGGGYTFGVGESLEI